MSTGVWISLLGNTTTKPRLVIAMSGVDFKVNGLRDSKK